MEQLNIAYVQYVFILKTNNTENEYSYNQLVALSLFAWAISRTYVSLSKTP